MDAKEETLKDGYECGIDASVFDNMHKKLPQRNDPHNLLEQQTLYGPVLGKSTNFIGCSSAFRDYFRRLQFPSKISVKHAFDKILKSVDSENVNNMSENQPPSELFNHILTYPSESILNSIYYNAEHASTSSAQVVLDADSDKTPSPPPQKSPKHHEIPITEPLPNSENVQPEKHSRKTTNTTTRQ
jgi:hypothetical protein